MKLDIKYLKIIIALGFMISSPVYAHDSSDHNYKDSYKSKSYKSSDHKSSNYKYSHKNYKSDNYKNSSHKYIDYKYNKHSYKDYGYNKKIYKDYYNKSKYKSKHHYYQKPYYPEKAQYIFIFNDRTLFNYTKMSSHERKYFLKKLPYDKRIAFHDQYGEFERKHRKRLFRSNDSSLSFKINLG